MGETTASAKVDTEWSDERTIREYFPALNENGAVYKLASSLPLGLGLLIYAPAYVIRVLNPFSIIRYTLTNRRLRVDKGTRKNTVRYVALEDVDDIRVTNYLPFTRTGNVEIISQNEVVLNMVGLQNPMPIKKTIDDAIQARVGIMKVLEQQRKNREMAAAAG